MPGLSSLRDLIIGPARLRGLGGQLDESLDAAVFDPGGAKHLALDVERLSHITSFGVREWIRALKQVRQKLDGLYFVRASPRMTDQFNMVMGFDAGGSLLSFRAYYDCEGCGEESECSFDTQLDREAFDNLTAPPRQCRVCGRDAVLDDDPSVLFEYVRTTRAQPPPPEVLAVMRDAESWLDEVPGVRLMTRSNVIESTTVYRFSGIIDKSLPVRRLAENTGGPVQLALGRVSNVDPGGVERWKALVSDLAAHNKVTLTTVPPVILRRAVEDRGFLAGVGVATVVLPMRCNDCRLTTWVQLPAAGGEPRVRVRQPCKLCSKPMSHVCPPNDLLAFEQALADRPAEPMAISPGAVKPAASHKPPPPAAPKAPTEGFDQKYEPLCRIGQGGMADVFLVRMHGAMGFKRLVVIKKVRKDFLTDDRMLRLFLDEARAAARVEHNNVVRVHDLGRADETFYMVMDFVHGRSLVEVQRELKRHKATVPAAIAATIAADVCAGLARAHMPDSMGHILVHRDVTPNNIMVSFDGVVRLCDFGLAGYHHFEKDPLRRNHILGNVPFIAPEIYLGEPAVPQSDLWGVGLTLYVMLTGQHPFQRDSVDKTALSIVNDKVSRPWGKIPRKLFAIIDRSLAKKVGARYANAAEMERDLRAVIPKLGGSADISAWIRQLFQHQLKVENDFVRRAKVASLPDAFLSLSPSEVARFYRTLRAGLDMGAAPPDANESGEAQGRTTTATSRT